MNNMSNLDPITLERAAELLASAEALAICAGAGMGVDSGLPDFRGAQGFWRAYPMFEKSGLSFADVANPAQFRKDPALAWGFYGHRLNLYRATQPHEGFLTLLKWARGKPLGHLVFTSNVDGHFQKSGFAVDAVIEPHGSIHFLQCMNECGHGVFSAASVRITVDTETMRATSKLPACPACGGLARPNILMFDDAEWDSSRSASVSKKLHAWLKELPNEKLIVIECGAGKAIPTVRYFTQQLILSKGAKVIRINPREEELISEDDGIALRSGAKAAIDAIDACVKRI